MAAVFVPWREGNQNGRNPDLSQELWLADLTRQPAIVAARGTPTVVTWSADPSAVRYDVLRGDLDQLQVRDGQVDLGTVTCLADDLAATATTDTAGRVSKISCGFDFALDQRE